MPHDPSHPERNEDAFRAELTTVDDGWSAFLVLSDGAGSTLFAGDWARALVAAADTTWVDGGLLAGVEHVRASFDPLSGLEREIDFMHRQKWRDEGSAATFLVAVVQSDRSGTTCRAAGIGDSLLLLSEPDKLASFPLKSSPEFTNRTETVRTHPVQFTSQEWQHELVPGSMLALSSDAIGKWLLRRYEQDGPGTVHRWLRQTTIGNLPSLDDDVTLVVLDVPPAARNQPPPNLLARVWRIFGG